ncbi:GNAT family N-acetyltransferase [Phycicoccus flavus]|uniref:GNAT family N-acetyltransferase n=1 Tax=Phycicoccus flavus TaxID=2502783 RepID=UPI001F3D08E4|nr:GNAT family N-acetyltransferase [Phycicoccus flavus]
MGENAYRVEVLDPGRDADLADLAAMRTAWTREQSDAAEDGFARRLGEWWEAQAGSRRLWVVRTGDARAVGMANLQVFDRMPRPGTPDARWAYVANVWTDPAHRRRGVGRLLVDTMLAWCREEGMVRVVLNPSQVSRPLYRSAGFRPADDLMVLELRAER